MTVQLCGDAHLSNFGLFGTPERQMLFDINDFAETLPGPWEWDMKRLAASFEVLLFSPRTAAGIQLTYLAGDLQRDRKLRRSLGFSKASRRRASA